MLANCVHVKHMSLDIAVADLESWLQLEEGFPSQHCFIYDTVQHVWEQGPICGSSLYLLVSAQRLRCVHMRAGGGCAVRARRAAAWRACGHHRPRGAAPGAHLPQQRSRCHRRAPPVQL